MFTWKPFFTELFNTILSKYNKTSLVSAVTSIFGDSYTDKTDENTRTALFEFDPLSFLALFNRNNSKENKIEFCRQAKEYFNLHSDVPKDFDGIPIFNPQSTWLFAYAFDRGEHDIDNLWKFSYDLKNENIKEDFFNTILDQKMVGLSKLSQAMLLVDADKYYPYDKKSRSRVYGENYPRIRRSYAVYLKFLKDLRIKFPNETPPEFSHNAHLSAIGSQNFWIFQCNPKYFRIADALNANALSNYKVSAHINKIRPGDKGIIWVTGTHGGCYAFFTVLTEPDESIEPQVEKQYWTDLANTQEPHHRCEIKIDLNIASDPITKESVQKKPWAGTFKAGNMGTNFELTSEQYNDLWKMAHGETGSKIISRPIENDSHPKNMILYGPPGTGKTYATIHKALEIINGDGLWNDRSRAVEAFAELKRNGQIEFVTFHQSYSYEEFVEGISPDVDDKTGQIKYIKKPGIFREIAQRAETNKNIHDSTSKNIPKGAKIWKVSLGSRRNTEIYESCIEHQYIGLDYSVREDLTEFDFTKYDERYKEYGGRWPLENFVKKASKGDVVLVLNDVKSIRAIGLIESDYIYNEDLPMNHTRKVKWMDVNFHDIYTLNQETDLPVTAFSSLPNMTVEKVNSLLQKGNRSTNKYVLVIDEINRGNVSKIFGELITLIEEDKRLGHANETKVMLPYSNTTFGVPGNLYILGTMNTADRSIATMDVALRRRFVFNELMPDASLVPEIVGGIPLRRLFLQLNSKINALAGRDYQLGHSYFIGMNSIEDIKFAWFHKIIPMLNEYFYEEWPKLKCIIKSFIINKKADPEFMKLGIPIEQISEFANIDDYRDSEKFKNAILDLLKDKGEEMPKEKTGTDE